MQFINNYYQFHHRFFSCLDNFSGLGPLALRLFLVPVFWIAGMNKVDGFESIVEWFGNAEWGLGLPFPALMAFLATGAEVLGAILLLIGFATRLITIPLMITMLVAMFAVHWENGWQATHDLMSWGANANAEGALVRLDKAKDILQEYGNYEWLTEKGNFVVLNNGIEFSMTYFVMLLALFFTGGGKFVSVDYYLNRYVEKNLTSD